MLRLYNTLTKRLDEVNPIEPGVVRMYTCGPTVYRDAHIGNLRSYLMADWIRRALEAQGLQVKQVKNITDVGHMRQEMLERGEDKVIAAAIAEGKTPAEIAQFYTDRFNEDEQKLNITPSEWLPKATDHIDEMIEITQTLIDKDYAYEVEGNVYFSVSRFADYGKLSGNIQDAELMEAVRVEADPLKRDPRDFTLWKKAEPGRVVKWPSPWGEGFPGWHIECSAMSIKYLGKEFDVHTGGVDNIFPHHEGEIAQSEGYTGNSVVNYWVHGQHLLADGVKMAKSAGNSFILPDIEQQGIDPMAFRYLCMTARYQTRLNFTFTSLKAAQRALLRLQNRVWEWSQLPSIRNANGAASEEWQGRFMELVDENLNMPSALSLTWNLVHSDLPPQSKLHVLMDYDRVMGLGLDGVLSRFEIPDEIHSRLEERASLRQEGKYAEADAIRDSLNEAGFVIQDTTNGTRARPKTPWEQRQEEWVTYSSSSEIASLIDKPDSVEITIAISATNYLDDVKRSINSVLKWLDGKKVEVLALDNGSTDDTGRWLEGASRKDSRIRVIHTDHKLGEAAAQNILLKQSRGTIVILLSTSIEVTGDLFGRLEEMLEDDTIGVAGPFGLRTDNMHHFHDGEGESGDMDAMQAYCFAFKRERLKEIGLMREVFRFYRNLDLDYSFHFKERGYRIVANTDLPVQRHEHRAWEELAEGERDEFSRKNYGRFLDKWGDRADLLVSSRRGD